MTTNFAKRIIGGIVLILVPILGMSGIADAAPAALSMTSTMAYYVIPSVPGAYTLNMWHEGQLLGTITAPSGSVNELSLKVPHVTPCTFQLDVQRDHRFVYGKRFNLALCGATVTTTTTTSTSTTTSTTSTTVAPVSTTTEPIIIVPPSCYTSCSPTTTVATKPPVPPVTGNGHGSGGLPFTGLPVDTADLVGIAVLMLLGGSVLLVVRRRRHV